MGKKKTPGVHYTKIAHVMKCVNNFDRLKESHAALLKHGDPIYEVANGYEPLQSERQLYLSNWTKEVEKAQELQKELS